MNRDAANRLNPSSLSYVEVVQSFEQDSAGRSQLRRPQRLDHETISNGSCAAASSGGRGVSAARRSLRGRGPAAVEILAGSVALQRRVDLLVEAYRQRGHIGAHLNPLAQPPALPVEFDPAAQGITRAQLDETMVRVAGDGRPPRTWMLRELVAHLQRVYCGSVGAQYMHIEDAGIRDWICEQLERVPGPFPLSVQQRRVILSDLMRARFFEQFLRKRFLGSKTFSLEGGEALIPLLTTLTEQAGAEGVGELVMAMAHRGRLNVLANTVGKDLALILHELLDNDPAAHIGGGDVKYHLGACGIRRTNAGAEVRLSLCFNPSHLEYVNPVAMGRTRAKRDRHNNGAICVLLHGDAAVIGEGVIQEGLNLSALPGYTTGGAVHVVVNNQIGFTTTPQEGRCTRYCTDAMRGFDVPVFHVNGDDPEAVVRTALLAMAFRREFGRDVAIDLCCYRRAGHSEVDEPSFTQPLMYRKIRSQPAVGELYFQQCGEELGVTEAEVERWEAQWGREYEQSLARAQNTRGMLKDEDALVVAQACYGGPASNADEVSTSVPLDRLGAILGTLTAVPEGFHLHRKLERGLERRRHMAQGTTPVDWATAEALALGSLSWQGVAVRLSGQDTVRGTFGQRHLTWHDAETGATYTPIEHLDAHQAPMELINSPLSEIAALGFEYGYSMDRPDALVLWEAQYGDFANAAQVIIDQFIASAEDKWERLSGLVLLLPHGFEGHGPEHSSARLERFLMLTAEDNIQVVYPTTSAQYFHLLRRQALRRWRKPLAVFTPKSLLRHEQVVSELTDLAEGAFRPVLGDPRLEDAGFKCNRVILCAGKVYYDLLEARERHDAGDSIALVRLEQLYPFPERELKEALRSVQQQTPLKWVQEEPSNMGAWRYMRACLGPRLFDRFDLGLVSRCESASPATGSPSAHRIEQQDLIARALGLAEIE